MTKLFYLFLLFTFLLVPFSYAQENTPQTSTKTVSIVAVGDILLASKGIEILIDKYGESFPFKKIKSFLDSGDITIGNLESCISAIGTPYDKKYTFRAHPKRIESLKYASFDILNLANNHSVDFGRDAFLDTLDILKKNDFKISGAGYNLSDAMSGTKISRNGVKFGFLGFSAVLSRPYHATKTLPGAIPSWPDTNITKACSNLKKDVDILVVSFHWGEELADTPTEYQTKLAHLAINSGADIIIGHHPHVIQGIEIYKDKPIFYSLGNFVFIPFTEKSKKTVLARITTTGNEIASIELYPIYIRYGQPRVLENKMGQEIASHILKLSKDLGTKLVVQDDAKILWEK